MSGSVPPPFRPPEPPPYGAPQSPVYSPPKKSGTSAAVWILGCFGVGCGSIVVAGIVGLVVVGALVGNTIPDTAIVPGPQVPLGFMEKMRSTGILEEGESIRYFYSDGMFDILEGFYILTDRKLALYSRYWDEPAIPVAFDSIAAIDVTYDDSFFTDSDVLLRLDDGTELYFPLSSEQGLDHTFIEALESASGVEATEQVR